MLLPIHNVMTDAFAPLLLAESLSSHFRGWDWAVLIGYLAVVSVLGVTLAGRQKSMEGFFRGGNKLPWYAVSASMIATIISAVTFIAVPAIAYRETGNFTYLQFGIIAGLLSRLFVAFVLVPAYYRQRIYSPYDYMANQLGEAARSVTTALFTLLGLLAQAARVYLTAIILQLILADQLGTLEAHTGISPFAWAVIAVGAIAIIWTMLGGIATVIWTDAMLFLVFIVGGLIALAVVVGELPGGLGGLFHAGWEAGKFDLWAMQLNVDDWREVFTEPYTLWAAVFAVTFTNIGSYGTDQLLAQRIFCCKNQTHAKLAVLSSWAGELVVALMLLVGVGLWSFYRAYPEALSGEGAAAVAANPDNIFPVFILTQVPVGLTGLIVAGIFAAAISSLTSILAALSQTTLSALYLPLRRIDAEALDDERHQREVLLVSRGLIVFWGVALCAMAFAVNAYIQSRQAHGLDTPFLDLALGLASYVIGALLAAFLLAWLPIKRDAYGLIWSAPLSVFAVVATRFHEPWTHALCVGVAGVLLLTWLVAWGVRGRRVCPWGTAVKTLWLIVGCAALVMVSLFGYFDGGTREVIGPGGAFVLEPVKTPVAWPWYAPIGGAFALVFGYLLAYPRDQEACAIHVAKP